MIGGAGGSVPGICPGACASTAEPGHASAATTIGSAISLVEIIR
jgi:hypothetical protein